MEPHYGSFINWISLLWFMEPLHGSFINLILLL